MRPRAKYSVIHRHRQEYPVSVMCNFFGVSRSGYYSFVNRLNRPEKDVELADIIRRQQKKCFGTYGYRRMWLYLKSTGINRNPKTILHVMKKYGYYSAVKNGYERDGMYWAYVVYNPIEKFDCNAWIDERVSMLYHITSIDNVNSIVKPG